VDLLIELPDQSIQRIKASEKRIREQLDRVRQACKTDIANAQAMFGGYFDLHRDSLRNTTEQAEATMLEAAHLAAQALFYSHAVEYRAAIPDLTHLRSILRRLCEMVISEFGQHTRQGVESMESSQIKVAEDDHAGLRSRADLVVPKRSPVESPAFWRSRRRDFVELAERQQAALQSNTHERWLKGYCFGVGDPVRGGFDGALISDFEDVATRAAYAIGCPAGSDPVKFWVHALGDDLRGAMNREVRYELFGGQESGGIIQDLIKSSAGFCSRLAAKTEREANGVLAPDPGEQTPQGQRPEIYFEKRDLTPDPNVANAAGQLTVSARGQKPHRKGRRDPVVSRIKTKVRQLRAEGADYCSICNRLGSSDRPPRAKWRDLPWPRAYMQHTSAVTKWLSEACSNDQS